MKSVLEIETLSKTCNVLAGIIRNIMWVLCGRKIGELSSGAGTFLPGFLQSTGYLTKKYRSSLLVTL